MGVINFANRIAKPRGHTAIANFSSPQATASVCTGLGGGGGPQDPTGHPGRDTDVISRPSASTIKDLSFYIGFTRIQSRKKHLGPCFGMNGHFRQDPDVISRLPETTIDFLSVYIGFRS